MSMNKLALSAALVFGLGTAASAATLFDVTDNPGGQILPSEVSIADGGVYGTSLVPTDSLSLGVRADGVSTSGAIGFTFNPSPLRAVMDIALSNVDFAVFGTTNIHLSTDGTAAGVFASETVNAAGFYTFFDVVADSPLFLIFDWANATGGSFNADVSINQVPVPAAGLLLLGGLGGLAAMRRRKSTAKS